MGGKKQNIFMTLLVGIEGRYCLLLYLQSCNMVFGILYFDAASCSKGIMGHLFGVGAIYIRAMYMVFNCIYNFGSNVFFANGTK